MGNPWFSRVSTASERSEEVWDALYRYRYDEDRQWADVLSRLLAGHLRSQAAALATYDVVTTCALYTGPRAARLWDYLRPVLEAAVRLAPVVPADPRLTGDEDDAAGARRGSGERVVELRELLLPTHERPRRRDRGRAPRHEGSVGSAPLRR